MNRLLPLSIFIVLIIVGCSEQQLHTYNTSHIKDTINKLDYKPEIPMYLPFEVKDINIETPQTGGRKMLSVKFKDQNNETLYFFTIHRSSNVIDFTHEKVKISDSVTGTYGEGPEGSHILRWKKDRIFYEITLSENYSKEETLEVAKNFKAVD